MHNTFVRTLRAATLATMIAAASILMFSCYPNSPEDAEDFDVVATFYKEGTDFTAFSTFSGRTDTIPQIQIKGADNIQLAHQFDSDLLSLIYSNLEDRGYTFESNPSQNKPDMVVLTGAAATTEYDPYESSPWFDYWGSWISDSLGTDETITWGLDYSWYSGSVSYSYDVGALVIMIVDATNISSIEDADKLDVLWMGSFNGLLSGSNVSIDQRVDDSINQMFVQSPYLSKTGQ
jgi:hypothetical protein